MVIAMNFTDAIAIFIQTLTLIQRCSSNTVAAYAHNLKVFQNAMEEQGVYQPDAVTPQHLDAFLNARAKNYEASSTNQMISTLRHFFEEYSFEHNIMNPALLLRVKKRARSLPSVLSLEEMRVILAIPTQQPRDILRKAILELLYASGMRVSECVNLQMNHLHFSQNLIKFIAKGGKERIVVINGDAVEALKKYIHEARVLYLKKKTSSFVFIGQSGKQISREFVYRLVKERLREVGIVKDKISPHSFRHTYATQLMEEGVNLVVIQELLGHSDISTTQIYTHMQASKLHEAYDQFHPRSKRTQQDNAKMSRKGKIDTE